MARPDRKKYSPGEEYLSLMAPARALGEVRDCAVYSLAAACGVPYETALAALTAAGRTPRSGTSNRTIHNALRALGFRWDCISPGIFAERYFTEGKAAKARHVTTHHPDRFSYCWPPGAWLMFTRGHVLAVVDGKNCDWSRGRSLRATRLYRITRIEE